MCKCNDHLSNKNVLSSFLTEFLLREESFILAVDDLRGLEWAFGVEVDSFEGVHERI